MASGYTYADYLSWPEQERWELIDGVAYAMAPAPARRHQEIVVEMVAQVVPFLRGTPCALYAAPFDVRLPRRRQADENTDTVVQPDLIVVCDRSKLDERGCRGAPDWVVEVLSPSTAAKDQIQKRALYERHGVREYWLVHPTDRLVTIYRLDQGGYGKPEILELKGQTPVGVVAGLTIDWELMPAAAGVGEAAGE